MICKQKAANKRLKLVYNEWRNTMAGNERKRKREAVAKRPSASPVVLTIMVGRRAARAREASPPGEKATEEAAAVRQGGDCATPQPRVGIDAPRFTGRCARC